MAKKVTRVESAGRFAAYGGEAWSARTSSLRDELGGLWSRCGLDSEWRPLRRVLLHEPGPELDGLADADALQMLSIPDRSRAAAQHRALARAFEVEGVEVDSLQPDPAAGPNQMFLADLFWMTPEGAIVGRPASTVRAGEERQVARRLADLGVPILHTVHRHATFEGADALWLRSDLVLIAAGLRTNREGIAQVSSVLNRLGIGVEAVELPTGAMHLMGGIRFLDSSRVLVWPRRAPRQVAEALTASGYEALEIPDESEALNGFAFNFVTVAPARVFLPAGAPVTAAFLSNLGVEIVEVAVDELAKAAGAIGCLTGILEREMGD